MGTSISTQNGLDQRLLDALENDHKNDMAALQQDHAASDKMFSQMFSDVTSFMKTTVTSMQETQQQMQRMMASQSNDYFNSMSRVIPQLC